MINGIDILTGRKYFFIQKNNVLRDLNGFKYKSLNNDNLVTNFGRIIKLNSISNLPQIPLPQGNFIYSNFDDYIIDGNRIANTYINVRGNVFATRRFIVTETVIIKSITLLRIPTTNWTNTSNQFLGRITIFNDVGGSIDGLSTGKNFITTEVILNPETNRLGGSNEYDIQKLQPEDLSDTILTPGEYNLRINGTGSNMYLAIISNNTITIDESKPIHPSPTEHTNHYIIGIEV